MDVAEARLLERCRSFRTLDEHAARCCAELGIARRHGDTIAAVLGQLAGDGLMIPVDELVRRARGASRRQPPPIATIGFVTRDRPGPLARAVESYVRNCARFGREPRFVVMDGSSRPAQGARLRRLLADLSRRLRIPVLYAGLDEKRAFLRRLRRDAGIPGEVLGFALSDPLRCGEPYGANRNALLLDSAGGMFLTADDDTICRGFEVPGATRRLVLSTGQPGIEYWFVRDLATGMASFDEVDLDLLGCHAGLLGRSPAALIGASPDLERVDPAFLGMLLSRRGRVRATVTGMLGDAGGASPIPHLLHAAGESRERLFSDYGRACASRDYLRAVRAPTVSRDDYFMATCAGLDARRLLPPFFPVFRCEDNLFGHVLARCDPEGLIGHLPSAIVHAPSGRRRYARDAVARSACAVPMAGVVAGLSAAADLRGGDVRGRMMRLGEHLEATAGPEAVRRALVPFLERTADRAERLLRSRRDAPAAWRADIRRYVAGLRRGPARLAASEFLGRREPERLTCEAIRRFGALLRRWPAIWEAARGRPMARPL